MSRLTEIIENHQNLDELSSIMRHYGVSAEYITNALIQMLEQEAKHCSKEEDKDKEEEDEEDKASEDKDEEEGAGVVIVEASKLMEDLKQFSARF